MIDNLEQQNPTLRVYSDLHELQYACDPEAARITAHHFFSG